MEGAAALDHAAGPVDAAGGAAAAAREPCNGDRAAASTPSGKTKGQDQDGGAHGPPGDDDAGAQGRGEFDWLVPYDSFRELLRATLARRGIAAGALGGLVLGCGTSPLSGDIVRDGVCGRVVSVDLEADCIAYMSERHAGDDRLVWRQCDLNDASEMSAALGEERFDLVLDKATLDAMVCDEDYTGYFVALDGRLACGGVAVVVSLHPEELVRPLLERALDGMMEVSCDTFTVDGVRRTFAALWRTESRCAAEKCACVGGAAPLDAAGVRERAAAVLDWFMQEAQPLLTPEREAALRAAFAAARAEAGPPAGSDGGSLPLSRAYELMFSEEERSGYSLEDFAEDAAASGEAREAAGRMTAEEAVRFLRANQ